MMLGKTQNQILMQVEQGIQAKVPPKFMGVFQRVIAAGEKVMYSPQSNHLMKEQLQQPGDPAQNIGTGVAKLLALLMEHGKNAIPPAVLPMAGIVLVCEAMDFAEKAGILQVTNEVVSAATKAMITTLLEMSGITPDKLHAMMAKSQQGQPGAQPPAGQPPAPPTGIIAGAAQGA